jgi:hypothetical protein
VSLYAENTSVPIQRSRIEIENMLRRYGADQLAYAEDNGRAMLGFRARGKAVRFIITLPAAKEFMADLKGRRRTPDQALLKAEGEHRRRWRCLMLVIKAKLEAVATGISVFEQEFFGHLVLPGGRTVYEEAGPQAMKMIEEGKPTAFNLMGPEIKQAK